MARWEAPELDNVQLNRAGPGCDENNARSGPGLSSSAVRWQQSQELGCSAHTNNIQYQRLKSVWICINIGKEYKWCHRQLTFICKSESFSIITGNGQYSPAKSLMMDSYISSSLVIISHAWYLFQSSPSFTTKCVYLYPIKQHISVGNRKLQL